MLSAIDIEDAVISIDANGTQREGCRLNIWKRRGHYLLSVKGNQKSHYEYNDMSF